MTHFQLPRTQSFRASYPLFAWWVGIFVVLLCIAVALGSQNILIGYPGDPSGSVWSFWWSRNHTASLFAPTQPVPYVLAKLLVQVMNPLAVYDFLIMLGTLLTGYCMYALWRVLGGSRYTAVMAGIIYAVMPGRQMQMYQHLSLADWFWYPLLLLVFIKLSKKPSWLYAMLVALVAVGAIADSYYNLILTIPIFIVGAVLCIKEWAREVKKWQYLLVSVVLYAVGTLFLSWNVLHGNGGNPSTPLARGTEELGFYSGHWWSYILPSIDHPLFGHSVEPYIAAHLRRGNAMEATQSLPLVLILTILGGVAWLLYNKKKRSKDHGVLVGIGVALLVLGVIFSFAPSRHIFGVEVALPAQYLHQYLPAFRVYARFGFIVATGAVLAYAAVSERLSKKIQAALFVLILIQCFWTVPFSNVAPPQVVHELSDRPEGTVLQFPFVGQDELRTNQYMYWESLSNRELLNRTATNAPTIFSTVTQDSLTEHVDRLQPTYIVINHDIYSEGRIPEAMRVYADPSYDLFPPAWQNKPQAEWLQNLGYKQVYQDTRSELWKK